VAASIVKTFAGSLTTAIAGGIANKVMNAAENAKTAKKEREAEGLEKAEGGSLFTSALKTEFGGEIFNKALGRKEIKSDTPKPTNKPNQSPPSSGGKPSDFVRKAQEALNQDDDSVLVKDEQVRKFTARLLGAGIENKLNVINYSVSELSNEVKSLNTNLVHTQKLVYDQNELLGAKFDSILDIFSAQRDYQKEVVESGKVARREAELEQKQDLSTTQKIQEFTKSKKRGSSNLLTNIIGDLIKKFLKRRSKNIVGAVLGRKLKISRIIKGLFQGKGPFGKMSNPLVRDFDTRYKKIVKRTVKTTLSSFTDYGTGSINDIAEELADKYPRAAADAAKDSAGSGQRFRTDLPTATRKPTVIARSGKDVYLQEMLEKGAAVRQKQGISLDKQRAIYEEAWDEMGANQRQFWNNHPKTKLPTPKPGVRADSLEDAIRNVSDDAAAGRNITKKMGKKGSKAAAKKATDKFTKNLGTEVGQKALNKGAERLVGKTASKSLKFIPGIGTTISIAEAGFRASQGDLTGAMLSLGSAIPFVGWGFVAADIARDVGFDPLNTLPDQQYETGSGLTKPGMGVLHGTEARITNEDRENSLNSMIAGMDTQISMLVSSARSLGDSTGTSREIQSEINKTGVPYSFVRIPFESDIGTIKSATRVSVTRPKNKFQQLMREQKIAKAISSATDNNTNNVPTPNDYDPSTPGINAEYSPDGPISYKSLPNNAVTIFRSAGQGPDKSGEHGIDFSFNDYSNNYAVFPGEVVSVEKRSDGYGMSVTIKSKDPLNNNQEFESLYAHFDPKGVAVSKGDTIHAGQYLGKVGWDPATGNAMPGAGGMSGWHTSLDFYEPNGGGWYRNASDLIRYVEGIEGQSPTLNYPNGKTYKKGGGGLAGVTLTSHAKRMIGDDTAFLSEVARLSKKYNVNPADMLAVFASESRFDPAADNGSHVGLIQFSQDSASIVGKTQAELKKMSRAEQMKYVEKYFDYWGVPKNATAGHLYAVVFAPAYANKSADFQLYLSPSSAYESNAPLDTNNDGAITIRELGGRTRRKKSEFGIVESKNLEKPDDIERQFGSGNAPTINEEVLRNIRRNDQLKEKYKNDPAAYFGTKASAVLDELEKVSSALNDTEESVAIQTVIITKTVVAKHDNSVISSNNQISNPLKDYQMAVLGV